MSDEKLFYLVAMSFPDDSLSEITEDQSNSSDPPSELLRFLSHIQLSMTASFLPPLPPLAHRRPAPLQIPGHPHSASSSDGADRTPGPSHLAPPDTPRAPHFQARGSEGDMLPITPSPFPEMKAGDEDYAHVEGIVAAGGSSWKRRATRESSCWRTESQLGRRREGHHPRNAWVERRLARRGPCW
jgi:hypothetical protein